MQYADARVIMFSVRINEGYNLAYDVMGILGKFFHVQDEVSTALIVNRLSSIYASNRSLPNGLYCIMPMYIEAGIICRPKIGIYKKNDIENVTPFARDLYIKSFFINNPMLQESDYDYSEHPYFEFI